MSKLGFFKNMEFLSRNCPGCGSSSDQASPAMHSTPRAEDLNFADLTSYWRGFKKKNIFFSYFRCSVCQLVYCPVYFTSEQLLDLYSFMGDNTAGEKGSVLVKTQESYLRNLSEKIEIHGSWLELGGDIGLLTEQLLSFSSVDSVEVLEPNLNVHEQLSETLKSRGKVAASWSGISNEKKFKGVIAIHVFDHLLDLQSELKMIIKSLEKEGSIFFVTHDESSILQKFLKSKWPPFCLQHPQLFNPESIKNILKLNGFNKIHVTKTFNYFTLRHIVDVATSVVGFGSFISKLCPNVTIKLKLGNIATFAQKTDLVA